MTRMGFLKYYRAARLYGYSNARVKAMEAKLVRRETLVEMMKLEDINAILAKLLQTDYRSYIEEFGDMAKRMDIVDFALNRSLAASVEKLVKITPKGQQGMMGRMVGMWDIYNIKLILYAKSMNRNFDYLSKYLVGTNNFSKNFVKELLDTPNIEVTASRLAKLGYGEEVKAAMAAYKKTGNITEANAAIDRVFYERLGGTIAELEKTSKEAAHLVRLNIDMTNILTLLRAKRYGMAPTKVKELLISNGMTPADKLMKVYDGSKDIKEIIGKVKSFDLKKTLERYESDKVKHMLLFEIGMKNQIFKKALSLLRHSVLSFSVLLGYFYLKEIEVFTLRISIMGRMHGLTSEEIAGMIEWQI